MNSAEEYLNNNGYENAMRWTKSSVIQVMQAYANHRIKQLLDVSEEELSELFPIDNTGYDNPNNRIMAMQKLGAKLFLHDLLNKQT